MQQELMSVKYLKREGKRQLSVNGLKRLSWSPCMLRIRLLHVGIEPELSKGVST